MRHLNLNLFAFWLQHAHKVDILLIKLVTHELSEPSNTLELAFNACFLPNFPN